MQLLHVHSGNLYGGVETMLLAFAESRAHLEHRFALCFDGPLAAALRARGAAVEILGAVRTRYPLSLLRARRRLAALLANSRCDAVACHMPWAQALFAPVLRRAAVRQIFWMHDAASGRHWLERWTRRTAPDFALCNSAYTAWTLRRLFPATPYAVLYPPLRSPLAPLSEQARCELRAAFATRPDAAVIVQASRFEPWKGHRALLQALRAMRDLPGWTCWIAGAPQRPSEQAYLQALRQEALDSGIAQRVRFCGFQPDIRNLLGAADIYCQLNTRAEPFGIALAEAMAAGLPIVAAASGGAAELIDSRCGMLAAAFDAEAALRALRTLLDDSTRRRSLGAAGRARATQLCDLARVNARLAAILEKLARPRPELAINQ